MYNQVIKSSSAPKVGTIVSHAMTLLNLGADCWSHCAQAQGACDWCGVAGACCRIAFASSPEACSFGQLGCDGMHCCVNSAAPIPAPPPAPALPPAWPPHALLVDPGENTWPTQWFGNLSTAPFSTVRPATWTTAGIADGYDFGLPPFAVPAARGVLTLHRSFLHLPDVPTDAANLPPLRFGATPAFEMWVSWRALEPSLGEYRLDALDANYAATIGRGWRFALRLLTARVAEAPEYLASMNISRLDGGARGPNYDPAHPAYHARYLALLEALRSRRFCQRAGVVTMYAGYASTSWGDEYIGPHGPSDAGRDPASTYTHVRQRLDGWATCCANATRKVLMGGYSRYGTSLGFGTRNGFVEHCACQNRRPTSERAQPQSPPCPLSLTSAHGFVRCAGRSRWLPRHCLTRARARLVTSQTGTRSRILSMARRIRTVPERREVTATCA